MAGRTAERLDQERLELPTVQHARATPSASRVETRVHGAESAKNGDDAGGLRGAAQTPQTLEVSQRGNLRLPGSHTVPIHCSDYVQAAYWPTANRLPPRLLATSPRSTVS